MGRGIDFIKCVCYNKDTKKTFSFLSLLKFLYTQKFLAVCKGFFCLEGKSMKKIIKTAVKILLFTAIILIVAIISVNIYVVNESKKHMYTPEDVPSVPKDTDCIIVLGAGLKKDGTPNHMLRDRLDLAVSLYNKGVCEKILLTGDHGRKEYDEVKAMKDYMLSKGIPEDALYLDHAGFSTYDSMYRAKEIFCVDSAVVITQEYHLHRAVYIGNALGMEIYGVNSDPYTYVNQTHRNVREYLARFKDFFAVMFDVKPKYLGEKIDIKAIDN